MKNDKNTKQAFTSASNLRAPKDTGNRLYPEHMKSILNTHFWKTFPLPLEPSKYTSYAFKIRGLRSHSNMSSPPPLRYFAGTQAFGGPAGSSVQRYSIRGGTMAFLLGLLQWALVWTPKSFPGTHVLQLKLQESGL